MSLAKFKLENLSIKDDIFLEGKVATHLLFNGVDASTLFLDETNKIWTGTASAQLDTAQKASGSASLLLDGNSDFISTPYSEDFDFWNTDWVLSFSIRFSDKTGWQCVYSQSQDGDNRIYIGWNGSALVVNAFSGAVCKADIYSTMTVSNNTWYKFVIMNIGGKLIFIKDGVAGVTTITTTYGEFSSYLVAPVYVGVYKRTGVEEGYVKGWIDDLMLSHGSTINLTGVVIDQYTKSLLHFDGANNGTTFTDETGKIWSPTGTAKLSTSKKAYGLSSLLLDGNSDSISTPSHADFELGNGDFTIDFWVNFDFFGTGYNHGLFDFRLDNNNFFEASFYNKEIGIECSSGGVRQFLYLKTFTTEIVAGRWAHIAIVRNGTSLLLFVNGTAYTMTENTAMSTKSIPAVANSLYIGLVEVYSRFMYGYIDEFRVSKGIARWTSDFAPGSPYGG